MFNKNIDKLRKLMKKIILMPLLLTLRDLNYLTGFNVHVCERLQPSSFL